MNNQVLQHFFYTIIIPQNREIFKSSRGISIVVNYIRGDSNEKRIFVNYTKYAEKIISNGNKKFNEMTLKYGVTLTDIQIENLINKRFES